MPTQIEVWGSVCFGDSISSLRAAPLAFVRKENPQKQVAMFCHQGMTGEGAACRLYSWRPISELHDHFLLFALIRYLFHLTAVAFRTYLLLIAGASTPGLNK